MKGRKRTPWPTDAWVTIIGLLTVLALVLSVRGPGERPLADADVAPSPTGTAVTAQQPTVTDGGRTAETRRTEPPPAQASPPEAESTTSVPIPSSALPDQGGDALASLAIAPPDPSLPPYRRSMFGDDWTYDPASGCNTRERVLIDESLVAPVMDDRCKPLSGRWVSLYDGETTTSPADLQIDHFVPLAEAWRSGAATWTGERRLAFANDLTDPNTLIAVTGDANIAKSDSAPHEWLPPDRTAWCTYVEHWVAVKARWGLSVTPVEHGAIRNVLAGC